MVMNWTQLLCSERARPSTNPGDHRAEFERDYDRTIFSTPVKRLQDKAQVFPLDPNDSVRTRLTHSLEVSSVARGLGISVGKWLLDSGHIQPEMARWIEAICSTCGLIHDLGNPPFGHSGEDAIRSWFELRFPEPKLSDLLGGNAQLVQDFANFEGNAQSLRLLTKLQLLADFNGLNLTYGTLSASCKYIAPSHESDKTRGHAWSKPGYFASENDVIGKIREHTGTGTARNPLTFLVEAADDIVYSVADVEDAVKKGVVSWRTVQEYLKEVGSPTKEALERTEKILGAGGGSGVDSWPDDVRATAFRTAAISVVVPSVVESFKEKYAEIMDGAYFGELVTDCAASSLVKQLKGLGRERVYCTSSNLKLELMGRKVICDLMDTFWEGAEKIPLDQEPDTRKFHGKAGALLSQNYRRVFQEAVKSGVRPEAYSRLQLVTDHVCGMTDSFATRLHSELTNG